MTKEAASQRVIIAGGSISGLTLALALQSAGIDFLVLERREVAPQLGASTGIHPFGHNILHQLGVHQRIAKLGIPLVAGRSYDDYGNLIEKDISVLSKYTTRSAREYTQFMTLRLRLAHCSLDMASQSSSFNVTS